MPTPTAQLLGPEIAELLRAGRYADLRAAMLGFHEADVAELIEGLEPDEAAVVFRLLPRDRAGEVFAHLESDVSEALIQDLGAEGALRIVESMDLDDRAALLDELPGEVTRRLVASLSPENRRQTQAVLGYPPESVGRLMTPDYVRVRPEWTVRQALDHLRKYGRDAETVHWVYVINERGRLVDDMHIRRLLLADPDATVETLLDGQLLALHATDDQEEAVRVFAKYDRSALPVTDASGVLLGIITHDDIIDVAEEEATEDFQLQGGVEALEKPYMQTGALAMVRKRGVWLGPLFAFQILTILVMGIFEEQLQTAVVLSLFVPLIISSGGNTGTQASSLLIRALALQQLGPSDWGRVLRKEVITGLLLGLVLGACGTGAALLGHATGFADNIAPWRVGLTIGVSIAAIVLWAACLGAVLPLILEKLGFDPATMSSPMVATLMDVSGLLIYFTFATLLLTGVLL